MSRLFAEKCIAWKDVSIFAQMSQKSSRFVSFFVQLSEFSSRYLIFCPDVLIFVQMSHFSSRCLIIRSDVSNATSERKMRHLDKK
ncbi:hypothetical protein V9T40_014936 [Parthenolecanium corni]|uniref:Uncharacterized protein n=1 Tax=Parthenolecanium corni TaxID=536013 RepID=A0AAN9Y6E8_9HEMI